MTELPYSAEANNGTTALDADEQEGLLPGHLQTQGELNEWEQANIADAVQWLTTRRSRTPILSIQFTRELHRRMFGKTWRWAGEFRKTEKTTGLTPSLITESLANLLEDTKYQLEQSPRTLTEVAARFHHRLVLIHPFANGNGRHARLMTDVMLENEGGTRFTWGRTSTEDETTRTRYIQALRSADQGDFSLLLEFLGD